MNRLTIWFTSDTHGYLFDTDFASRESKDIGLLGFRFPKDGDTLVIDGGDTIQGSPLVVYCRRMGERLPIADAMNALGYDYVTLGNHDFNCGSEWLGEHLNALNARCLCANVTDARRELPIAPYAVHTLENGLRVGLVGIVTDWVNVWEKPENLTRLSVSDPLPAARAAVEALQSAGVDILVGIYHGGVERDLSTGRLLSQTNENIACKLCEELPFDLLLTGHQHIAMVEKQWHGTHIVQTPCNATHAVKVTLDSAGAFHSELVPSYANPPMTAAQTELRERLERWLDEPIGHLSEAIWPADKLTMALNGSPIADFFNEVQLWASGADISCAALPNELRGFDSSVTVRDVVASYIYSNTLVELEVTGRVLRAALEQCARYFDVAKDGEVRIASAFLEPKEAHFNYDYFSGIEYCFDLAKPAGARVARLTRNGQPVDDDEHFTLVMCNYRATGAGDFGMYLEYKRKREIQTEVSELIISYIMEHPNIQIPKAHPIETVGYARQSV
ncbi:MAG: bifunctional metallophosphatase/5'-nucleotidase [Clostridia bacterium]|nr:bifunctional metallophosphatase/5'-nucleotidase [Clostridia bacterium]